MDNLVNQLEELRAAAKTQFETSFTDGLHAKIYQDWRYIMREFDFNPYAKMILMYMIEKKWQGKFTFTIGEMGEDIKINKKSLRHHIKGLEEGGLCKRVPNSHQWEITLKKVF